MNVDVILQTMADCEVDYLLIGGVNFLLRHEPELTFDIDFWIADTTENRRRTNEALRKLKAEWGPTEIEWRAVPEKSDWLDRQTVFCLSSPYGAIDIFREVKGLEGAYSQCTQRATLRKTPSGVVYHSLSDEDMLACQTALPEAEQKVKRIETLRRAISEGK